VSPIEDPRCYFCDTLLDEEHFCFGCHAYICDLCNLNPFVWGGHQVHDHKEPESEDFDEDELG
jgi:hypothetical protein